MTRPPRRLAAPAVWSSTLYDVRAPSRPPPTPLGFRSEILADTVGRVVRARAPIDSAQTTFQVDSTAYDAMDRTVHTESFGVSGVTPLAQRLVVDTDYDPAGNVLAVARRSIPDTVHIGTLTTRWGYDGAGRQVVEIAPDGARDSTLRRPEPIRPHLRYSQTRPGSQCRTMP